MSSQELVTTGVEVIGLILSLVALWLRLRFRVHDERERRRDLLTVAATLPAGSRIHEHRHDGTHLTLIVGATQRNEK